MYLLFRLFYPPTLPSLDLTDLSGFLLPQTWLSFPLFSIPNQRPDMGLRNTQGTPGLTLCDGENSPVIHNLCFRV